MLRDATGTDRNLEIVSAMSLSANPILSLPRFETPKLSQLVPKSMINQEDDWTIDFRLSQSQSSQSQAESASSLSRSPRFSFRY